MSYEIRVSTKYLLKKKETKMKRIHFKFIKTLAHTRQYLVLEEILFLSVSYQFYLIII